MISDQLAQHGLLRRTICKLPEIMLPATGPSKYVFKAPCFIMFVVSTWNSFKIKPATKNKPNVRKLKNKKHHKSQWLATWIQITDIVPHVIHSGTHPTPPTIPYAASLGKTTDLHTNTAHKHDTYHIEPCCWRWAQSLLSDNDINYSTVKCLIPWGNFFTYCFLESFKTYMYHYTSQTKLILCNNTHLFLHNFYHASECGSKY
jgi:hypothetical protein